MPKFGARSKERLDTCHPILREIFREVVLHYDCAIVEGHRTNERQEELLALRKTTLGAGQSKHNRYPSLAVDAAPYYATEESSIPWDNRERFLLFGGFVLGVATGLGYRLRWGGDWDGDRTFKDQKFHDLPHFELIGDYPE